MLRTSSAIVLLLCASVANAQGLMDRKHPDIFPLDGKMKRSGFFIAPGITYTLSRATVEQSNYTDGIRDMRFDPEGRFGPYLEAGWFLATRDPVILDYWDVSLAYKRLAGAQRATGSILEGWTQTTYLWNNEQAVFKDDHLTLALNANKLFQTTDYQFIQFSLGVNVDWRFGASREYETIPVFGEQFPPEFIGQAHAKLGYGFKVTQRLIIIPAVETPFFSLQPKDEGFGQLQWFNSRYRPLILSVRFLFLRYPNGWACPQVKNNEFEKHKVLNPSYERSR